MFEQLHSIKLPEELRAFYLECGNGRVGPDYGLIPLENLQMENTEVSYPGVDIIREKTYTEYPEERSEDGYFEADLDDITGLIPIVGEGCGHYTCIVCKGDQTGEIVYCSADCCLHDSGLSMVELYYQWIDKELKVFQDLTDMIRTGASLRNIDDRFIEEFRIYNCGDLIVSMLNIPKPVSIFGTPNCSTSYGTMGHPWYSEQFEKNRHKFGTK